MKKKEIEKRHDRMAEIAKAALEECEGAWPFYSVTMFLAGADAMLEACVNDEDGFDEIAAKHFRRASKRIGDENNRKALDLLRRQRALCEKEAAR